MASGVLVSLLPDGAYPKPLCPVALPEDADAPRSEPLLAPDVTPGGAGATVDGVRI